VRHPVARITGGNENVIVIHWIPTDERRMRGEEISLYQSEKAKQSEFIQKVGKSRSSKGEA